MARKKTLINKKIYKLSQGECRICKEKDPALLDVHRLIPGKEGGKYTPQNSSCICCRCHRKVHDGQIIITKYYPSSTGQYLLGIIENGQEKFI
jgi:hypothetical protein